MSQEFKEGSNHQSGGASTDNASSRNDGEGGSGVDGSELSGLRPTTSASSKMVVLAAERGDRIKVCSKIREIQSGQELPDVVTVLRRNSTYYGPKLLVHAEIRDVDHNYLITAPGPASELMVWGAETDDDKYRKGWYRLAEIEAQLADDQPTFDVCPQCNNPVRSNEHERMASIGMCNQ